MQRNMFHEAAKQKIRFETVKGLLPAEDLFDFPLTSKTPMGSLDDIHLALDKLSRENEGSSASLINRTEATDKTLELKLNIVVAIITERLEENAAANNARATKEQAEKIMAIMSRKQDAALEETPMEELKAILAQLTGQAAA